jgi:hypothetical protein
MVDRNNPSNAQGCLQKPFLKYKLSGPVAQLADIENMLIDVNYIDRASM